VTEFVVRGWSGANPLHVLAALGLLRLGARLSPGLRMAWQQVDGAWRPVYSPVPDAGVFTDRLAHGLRMLGTVSEADPALNSRVRRLNTALKNARKEREQQEKTLRALKREAGLSKEQVDEHRREILPPLDAEVQRAEDTLREAQSALQRANGLGIAHIGDAIGVGASAFRHGGREALELWLRTTPSAQIEQPADPSLLVSQWPALASDAVQDQGKVVPTPYSFSNGSGGQYLLKDFRSCAARLTPTLLRASLGGQGSATVDDATSLNWDPSDQVSHALVWQDPQHRDKATDVGANALAYLGLSLVPAVPRAGGLQAVGWHKVNPGGFVWPIWSVPLGIDPVASLMAAIALDSNVDMQAWRARGVHEVRLASRVNPDGKRNFFAPSRPVG
jgi:hypothetical protein